MEPEAVAGLEIGDLGDRQRDAVAGDAHVDAGADKVETRVHSRTRPDGAEYKNGQQEQAGAFGHALV
jgi:hypothetical protein